MTSGGFRSVRHYQRREHDHNPGRQRVRDDHRQPAAVRICRGWSAGRGDQRFQEIEARFPLNPGAGVRGIPCPRFLFQEGFTMGFITGVLGLLDSTIQALLTVPLFAVLLSGFLMFAALGLALLATEAAGGRRRGR